MLYMQKITDYFKVLTDEAKDVVVINFGVLNL